MMDHEREDTAMDLDPVSGLGRWEGLVASIVRAAGPELARRRERQDVASVVISWARPALSAAATIALLVAGALAVVGRTPSDAVASQAPIENAIVPEEFAAWLVAGYEPTVTELVVAIDLEGFDR